MIIYNQDVIIQTWTWSPITSLNLKTWSLCAMWIPPYATKPSARLDLSTKKKSMCRECRFVCSTSPRWRKCMTRWCSRSANFCNSWLPSSMSAKLPYRAASRSWHKMWRCGRESSTSNKIWSMIWGGRWRWWFENLTWKMSRIKNYCLRSKKKTI